MTFTPRAFLDGSAGSRPLSESQLVALALEFANAPGLENTAKLMTATDLRREVIGPKRGRAAREFVKSFEEEHARFKSRLKQMMQFAETKNVSGERFQFIEGCEDALGNACRILMVPTFSFDRRGTLVVQHRYEPESLEAILSYVFLLLLDSSRPYGHDLCRCRLATCGRFFLSPKPKTGRRRTRYCSSLHMNLVHEADSSRRVAESRRRRAEARNAGTKRPRSAKQ